MCEVPGWGYQLAPARVLAEMKEVGLEATELGPQGWLPADPVERAEALKSYGLAAVGAFVPVVLHDAAHDPRPAVRRELDGYDERPVLDERGWATMCANLDRLAELATSRGLKATLHPHVGTSSCGPTRAGSTTSTPRMSG